MSNVKRSERLSSPLNCGFSSHNGTWYLHRYTYSPQTPCFIACRLRRDPWHALPHGTLLGLMPRLNFRSYSRWRRSLRDSHIQLSKLWSCKRDIKTCCVEHAFVWRKYNSQIRVLGEPRDEEHEAASFDLHFCEVGASCGNACVLAMKAC